MNGLDDFLTPFPAENRGTIPTDNECFLIWDKYLMPANIKEHSFLVGEVATIIAEIGFQKGLSVNSDLVRASALLHDLGKAYALRYGGNHSQIGAAWVMEETQNPAIAQGVMHHVFWPTTIDLDKYFLPIVVLYADKRVKHTTVVSIDERYEDILNRYGTSAERKKLIYLSYEKVKKIEKKIFQKLGVNLNENNINRWRMVS